MSSDGHPIEAEAAVRKLIADSIFGEFVTGVETLDSRMITATKENHQVTAEGVKPKTNIKVMSKFSAVIVGLKTYLTEVASDLVGNITEDFFNPLAKEFKPTKVVN